MVVRVTIDSTEPLDDVVRVVGAMYGVTLVVSDSEPQPVASPTPDLDTATSPSTSDAAAGTPSEAAVPETTKPPRKRPSRRGGRVSRARKAPDRGGNAQIRSWARDNGYTVSDRGRVPATIVAAYRDAHA